MPRFDGLLSQTVANKLAAFQKAENYLFQLVREINEVLAREADNLAELKLGTVRNVIDEVIYELSIDSKKSSPPYSRDVDSFRLKHDGYPIEVGELKQSDNPRRSGRIFECHDYLSNEEELEKYFEELLTKPSSPIVIFLAFLRRDASGF